MRELLLRTVHHYVEHLGLAHHLKVPELKLELVLDESQMTFFPPATDLGELLHWIIGQTNSTLQQVNLVLCGKVLVGSGGSCGGGYGGNRGFSDGVWMRQWW